MQGRSYWCNLPVYNLYHFFLLICSWDHRMRRFDSMFFQPYRNWWTATPLFNGWLVTHQGREHRVLALLHHWFLQSSSYDIFHHYYRVRIWLEFSYPSTHRSWTSQLLNKLRILPTALGDNLKTCFSKITKLKAKSVTRDSYLFEFQFVITDFLR